MSAPDIKKQLASGIFYTAIAKYLGIFMSIIITGVLSRLLTPEEFGTIVPVTIIVSFFTIIGDVGIGSAIIQNNNLSQKGICSIFSFTILVGAGLSLLFFMSSWLIADIYDNEIFVLLCQLLTLSLFFACASVVPNALLYKAKMFRYLAVRSLIIQSVAGVIAIVSAFWGAGLYALIVQSVISNVFLFIVSYHKNPLKLNLFKIEAAPLREIRNFSSYQFLFNVVNFFTVNLDKLLLGKFMGAAQLGYYDKSYRLMQLPLQNIPYVITPVMHPIFSDMQTDMHKMESSYSKFVRFLAFVGFPLSVVLYFTGQELIYILFGMQWEPSVPAFEILALSVGFQIVLSTSGSIFQASNSTHLLLLCGILSTATIVVAILTALLAFNTIETLALFLLCAFIFNFLVCYYIMYCVLFKVGYMPFLKQLISPFILSGVLAGVLYLESVVVPDTPVIISLIIKLCIAGLIFGAYIHFTKEYNLVDLIHKVRHKLKGKQF